MEGGLGMCAIVVDEEMTTVCRTITTAMIAGTLNAERAIEREKEKMFSHGDCVFVYPLNDHI